MTFEEDLIREVRDNPIVWNKQCADYKNRTKSDLVWSDIARSLNRTKNEVKGKWRNLRDVFQKEQKKVRTPLPEKPHEVLYTGKWVHYNEMLFLKQSAKTRSTLSNCSQESIDNYNYNDESLETKQYVQGLKNVRPDKTLQGCDDSNIAGTSGIMPDRSESSSSDDDSIDAPAHNHLHNNLSSQNDNTYFTDATDNRTAKRRKETNCSEFHCRMLELEKEKINAIKEREQDDEDILFLKSLAPYFKYLNPVQKLRLKSKLQNIIADEITATINQGYQQDGMISVMNCPDSAMDQWVDTKHLRPTTTLPDGLNESFNEDSYPKSSI